MNNIKKMNNRQLDAKFLTNLPSIIKDTKAGRIFGQSL